MSEALVEVIGLIPPCDAGALGLVRAELEGIEEIAAFGGEARRERIGVERRAALGGERHDEIDACG